MPRDLLDQRLANDGIPRRISASTADHYRAVPLSDGYHILFTDPKTRNLCLGTDAPVGSLSRLIRKVWFRPPARASSSLPVLYTAGSDTRHGVRVAATFSVSGGDDPARFEADDEGGPSNATPPSNVCCDKQIIVFYTIPPDMFHDISRVGFNSSTSRQPTIRAEEERGELASEWVNWRPEERYHGIDAFSDPFRDTTVYPLEIQGQSVAICCNLVELALDSGPDMILWALSAEGWARTWALHTGRGEVFSHTSVQRDGSLRHVDPDGNFVMAEVENPDTSDINVISLAPFDGTTSISTSTSTSSWWPSPPVERYRRLLTGWEGDRMSGTVSVDLVEEVSGIARMDVELR
ncbi:Fc.00g092850.m01.CDS01 [Cosmosporella sp. VM-42]